MQPQPSHPDPHCNLSSAALRTPFGVARCPLPVDTRLLVRCQPQTICPLPLPLTYEAWFTNAHTRSVRPTVPDPDARSVVALSVADPVALSITLSVVLSVERRPVPRSVPRALSARTCRHAPRSHLSHTTETAALTHALVAQSVYVPCPV